MTDDRKHNTGGEVELLPLPKPPYIDEHNLHGGRLAYSIQQMKDYARANVDRALDESRKQLSDTAQALVNQTELVKHYKARAEDALANVICEGLKGREGWHKMTARVMVKNGAVLLSQLVVADDSGSVAP